MPVISVPTVIAELVPPVEGAEIVTWDVVDEPPRTDVEVVVIPQSHAPFITRLGELRQLRGVILSAAGYDNVET